MGIGRGGLEPVNNPSRGFKVSDRLLNFRSLLETLNRKETSKLTTSAIITAIIGSAITLKFMDAYDKFIERNFKRSDKSK